MEPSLFGKHGLDQVGKNLKSKKTKYVYALLTHYSGKPSSESDYDAVVELMHRGVLTRKDYEVYNIEDSMEEVFCNCPYLETFSEYVYAIKRGHLDDFLKYIDQYKDLVERNAEHEAFYAGSDCLYDWYSQPQTEEMIKARETARHQRHNDCLVEQEQIERAVYEHLKKKFEDK